jgi:ketosteroid isomerase-like protein
MTFKKIARFTSFAVLGMLAAKAVFAGKRDRSGKDRDARRAVEAANARFRLAVQAKQAGDMAAFYEDTAWLLPPNQAIVMGRPGIQAYWQTAIDSGVEDLLLASLEIEVSGQTVVENGVYATRVQPAGKPGAEDNGKYVVVWKRQADGSLAIATDIWNSNLPVRP